MPFSSINYGTDTTDAGRLAIRKILDATMDGLGHGETPIFPVQIFRVKDGINFKPGDPNYDLYKYSMEVTAKRLFPNYEFLDAPYNMLTFDPNDIRTWCATMGCRTRVLANVNGPAWSHQRGNLSFTSINLPRIGIMHMRDQDSECTGFFNDLDHMLALVEKQLMQRYEYQAKKKVKNFPFLHGEGVWLGSDKLDAEDEIGEVLKHGSLSIGFIGLAECLVALTGKHHGESEYSQELGLKIIGHMRKWCDDATTRHHMNFTLLATPAEGLSGRFIEIDKKKFGIISGVTDKEYYTNSFHLKVSYPINAFDKISIEAPYHALCNAGHISYIELDGDPSNNIEAIEQILAWMKTCGIGYGSINHPVDRDPVCGYTGIINDVCPRCGRRDGEAISVEKLKKLGVWKYQNADTVGYHGDSNEENDRLVNSTAIPFQKHVEEV